LALVLDWVVCDGGGGSAAVVKYQGVEIEWDDPDERGYTLVTVREAALLGVHFMTEKQFSVWLMGHIKLAFEQGFPGGDHGFKTIDIQGFADEVLDAARCVRQTHIDEMLKGNEVLVK
jgi:hypothetical protein